MSLKEAPSTSVPAPETEGALVSFLRSSGADSLEHSGRTLLAHLIGTFQVLSRWRSEPYVCSAGLFHSIYGTAAFHDKMLELDKRDIVREYIGQKAELLVYWFCTVDLSFITTLIQNGPPYLAPCWRDSPYIQLDVQNLIDLTSIKWANVIEQASYTSFTSAQKEWLWEECELSSEVLPQQALSELHDFLGPL